MAGGEKTPRERTDDAESEVVRLLFQRGAFVGRLSEGGATKSELIDDLDRSRSTVDRGIRELQIEGLVEKRPDGYGLTQYGEMALYCYRRFLRDLTTVRRSRESLLALPSSTDIHPVFFEDGLALSERDGRETSPGAFLRELLDEAETFWTVTKSPHFELISLAHRKVVEEDMTFRLVHSVDTVDRLLLHYPDIVESALASGNLDLYSLNDPPPFGLIKASRPTGETVVLVLYGGQSEAEAVVVNETTAAVDRFDEIFEQCTDDSSRVEIDG